MELKSPPTCPYTVTVRRNPHRKARPTATSTKHPQNSAIPSSSSASVVPSFPIEEILAMEVPKNPNPASENLRVFLRIRPILPSKDQNPKSRAKNAWPQNPSKKNSARERTAVKKNSGDVCITVNDSQSVTLSPPLSLKETKRIKSEVYEGFSHVFPTDSSQEQVFEKMVSPLVEEFLKGKSGMLAALGPSGSGKTHTVFGIPRDPGIVPRTLQRIFQPDLENASESRRSFSLSIFEIHSERGKGEKLFDLSPSGAELSMQNSTIRGLQEITVSDAKEAETLVAQAMLRRLTATTNSNSQSSRSQCIISIRSVANNSDRGDESQAHNAVLSIIDLAGAEREKKTGNKGARLLESNFINNTSMVFGLCLRSLLEHQKNPKKPLQKHFQNSLLTRYLRDYLEGKKRMALILTVKSGEDDYLDTTYLLRQASPLMSIKFDNVEEQSNIPCNKRQSQAVSRQEKPKRMKFSGSDGSLIAETKTSEDEQQAPVQGVSEVGPEILKSELPNCVPLKANDDEFVKTDRSYRILQSFAKAMWSVLKLHGKKLKESEDEIQRLTENLELEKTRNAELGKELERFKSKCKCLQQKSAEVALTEAHNNFEPRVELSGPDSSNFDKPNVGHCSFNVRTPECNGTPKMNDLSPKHNRTSSQINSELRFSYLSPSETHKVPNQCSSNDEASLNFLFQEQEKVENEALSSDSKALEFIDKEQAFDAPETELDIETLPGYGHNAEDAHNSIGFESNHACANADVADDTVNSSQPLVIPGDDSCSSVELEHVVIDKDQELLNLLKTGTNSALSSEGCTTVSIADRSATIVEKPQKPQEPVNEANVEQRVDSSVKAVKSKRRLLPASSSLLRDFNTLDIGDKIEKPKGNRGGKKLYTDERNITQGNISLMRLLQNNFRG